MAIYENTKHIDSEDWPFYQRLVIDKLDELKKDVDGLKEEMTTMRVEMATQKTKMSMIGAGMGLAAATAAELVWRILGNSPK